MQMLMSVLQTRVRTVGFVPILETVLTLGWTKLAVVVLLECSGRVGRVAPAFRSFHWIRSRASV